MDTKEAAETVIEAMKTLQQKILIEKFIVNPGEDIRGIVAGDVFLIGHHLGINKRIDDTIFTQVLARIIHNNRRKISYFNMASF
ncbi:MAG: hypothetical protein ABIG89_01025 [Candidatus Woesearchaeota archaeon]